MTGMDRQIGVVFWIFDMKKHWFWVSLNGNELSDIVSDSLPRERFFIIFYNKSANRSESGRSVSELFAV